MEKKNPLLVENVNNNNVFVMSSRGIDSLNLHLSFKETSESFLFNWLSSPSVIYGAPLPLVRCGMYSSNDS